MYQRLLFKLCNECKENKSIEDFPTVDIPNDSWICDSCLDSHFDKEDTNGNTNSK